MRKQKTRSLLVAFLGILFGSCTTSNALEITTRQISGHNGDIYETVDGTIFKIISFGYVGYIGYHEEIIFLSNSEVCLAGDTYGIEFYEVGSNYHWSINEYEGADAYAKYEEICGDI